MSDGNVLYPHEQEPNDLSPNDPRFPAALDLLRRTGMTEFQMRYEDEKEPVVWMAVAIYPQAAEVEASLDPLQALLRLCERLIDGGMCLHCDQPTVFSPDIDTDMLDMFGCVYAWDPELKTFRRGCKGDDDSRIASDYFEDI